MTDDVVRVYVGTDRSQQLAVPVLEHSIKRHTRLAVEVHSLLDVQLPQPRDPRNWSRTNFSFARFAIPRLAGYRGRALYLDADMQVFADIAELWQLPFDGAKIIIQEDVGDHAVTRGKLGAPRRRTKQCSVMLLDCAALADWVPERIIAGLDGEYDYRALMSELCILEEHEVRYGIPFRWNSLEHYEPGVTCLVHYTDMPTQPWVSPENPLGWVWLAEVRSMLDEGTLSWSAIEEEVRLGYFRPSLLEELRLDADLSRPDPARVQRLLEIDARAGYVKHREVYERKEAIEKAQRDARLGGGLMHALRTMLPRA